MFKYDAFITYSRKDIFFSKKLEKNLEQYRIPGYVRKKLLKNNFNTRLNIFRDIEDLSGNELTPALKQSLTASKNLIVLVSNNSKISKYVGLEIQTFVEKHGKEKVIPVIIEGDPSLFNSDESPYHPKLLEFLPEPLAVDFRPIEGEKFFEKKNRLFEAKFQIIAQILGVEKSDLIRRYLFRKRLIILSLFIIGFLILGLIKVSIQQHNLALKQKAETLFEIGKSKSYSSEENLIALAYTIEAIRTSPRDDDNLLTYLRNARQRIQKIPTHFSQTPLDSLEAQISFNSIFSSLGNTSFGSNSYSSQVIRPYFSENGRYITFFKDRNLIIWNLKEGKFLKSQNFENGLLEIEGKVVQPHFHDDLDLAVIIESSNNQFFLRMWKISNGELIKKFKINIPNYYCQSTDLSPSILRLSDDGNFVTLTIPCTGGFRESDKRHIEKNVPGTIGVFVWSIKQPTLNPTLETNTDIFKSHASFFETEFNDQFKHEPYLFNFENSIALISVKNFLDQNEYYLNIFSLDLDTNQGFKLTHFDPIISTYPFSHGQKLATITRSKEGIFELCIWNIKEKIIEHREVLASFNNSIKWYLIEGVNTNGTIVISDSNRDRIIIRNFFQNKCLIIPMNSNKLNKITFNKNTNNIYITKLRESSQNHLKYLIETWDLDKDQIVNTPFEISEEVMFKINGSNGEVLTLNTSGKFYSWNLQRETKQIKFKELEDEFLKEAKFLKNGELLLILSQINESTPYCQVVQNSNFNNFQAFDFSTYEKTFNLYLYNTESLTLKWKEPFVFSDSSQPLTYIVDNEIHLVGSNRYCKIELFSGHELNDMDLDPLFKDSLIYSLNLIQLQAVMKPALIAIPLNEPLFDFGREHDVLYVFDSTNYYSLDRLWSESRILAIIQDSSLSYLTFSETGVLRKNELENLKEISSILRNKNFNFSEFLFGLKISKNNNLVDVSNNKIKNNERSNFMAWLKIQGEKNSFASHLLKNLPINN